MKITLLTDDYSHGNKRMRDREFRQFPQRTGYVLPGWPLLAASAAGKAAAVRNFHSRSICGYTFACCGRNSMAECQPSKLAVVGSSPIARFIIFAPIHRSGYRTILSVPQLPVRYAPSVGLRHRRQRRYSIFVGFLAICRCGQFEFLPNPQPSPRPTVNWSRPGNPA